MPVNKIKYAMNDALAYAVVAFHFNNDRVLREDVKTEKESFVANRNYIRDALEGKMNLMVTKAIKEEAKDIKQYLEQVRIVQNLKGRSNDQFLQTMIELLSKETVTARDLGLLAWAPKVAADYHKKDAVNEKTSPFEYLSRWVGNVKDKITIDFTSIETKFVKSMNIWLVFGHDENGNLIQFWASTEGKIINKGRIQGRVKKHIKDSFRNEAKVTMINYVKAIE